MNVRWLSAWMIVAGIALVGCKSEEQCWVDHAAETSFCNDDFYECWRGAENRYEATACYNDTYDSCMDDAQWDLIECSGAMDCFSDFEACYAAADCSADDETCLQACTTTFLDCWGEDSCLGERLICEATCPDWDDTCLDSCKVDMFVCSGGGSCTQADPSDGMDEGAWECSGEGWYDWICEETCNSFGNFCATQAECKEPIEAGENCSPDQLLDLDLREEFEIYIDAMMQCEEDRRICTMCCYDVDYHEDISCSDIDWDAMAEDFPVY